MTDRLTPYPMEERLEVGAEALRALADPTRSTIVTLLNERAASITQLAGAMGRPKGSIGHHVKVLEDAGLIKVVDTRKVRAMTERFYGRTARWFMLSGFAEAGIAPDFSIQKAIAFRDPDPQTDKGFTTARYGRIPAEQAKAFAEELLDLVDRFLTTEPDGDTVYAIVAGLFPTTLPTLGATND